MLSTRNLLSTLRVKSGMLCRLKVVDLYINWEINFILLMFVYQDFTSIIIIRFSLILRQKTNSDRNVLKNKRRAFKLFMRNGTFWLSAHSIYVGCLVLLGFSLLSSIQ